MRGRCWLLRCSRLTLRPPMSRCRGAPPLGSDSAAERQAALNWALNWVPEKGAASNGCLLMLRVLEGARPVQAPAFFLLYLHNNSEAEKGINIENRNGRVLSTR